VSDDLALGPISRAKAVSQGNKSTTGIAAQGGACVRRDGGIPAMLRCSSLDAWLGMRLESARTIGDVD
jgi:hypothetical protein